MNFIEWVWSFALFAFYTDPGDDPIWVDTDLDENGNVGYYIFFATTRPIDDPTQLQVLSAYGWAKLEPKTPGEYTGSVFRHPGW